jgi:hypothetical protein
VPVNDFQQVKEGDLLVEIGTTTTAPDWRKPKPTLPAPKPRSKLKSAKRCAPDR